MFLRKKWMSEDKIIESDKMADRKVVGYARENIQKMSYEFAEDTMWTKLTIWSLLDLNTS